MALAFVNSRPFLTSNIIGARTMEQLQSNIESINIKLPKDILRSIDEIHNQYPNPCP
jgi:aryl-alcohol dehydrogenase-like predicted oxidoreductase